MSRTPTHRPARRPAHTPRNYQHFLETLEVRTMLSSAPLLPKVLAPNNNAPPFAPAIVASQTPSAFASIVSATVVSFPEGLTVVSVPEGYNVNDWTKYQTAAVKNGLTADMV
ncbi:MAG: hypothetical protein FWD53_07160, partial [Phycisphaerales bacterium]|nr:hypothetical protein [Phycisphaerales bacterium]